MKHKVYKPFITMLVSMGLGLGILATKGWWPVKYCKDYASNGACETPVYTATGNYLALVGVALLLVFIAALTIFLYRILKFESKEVRKKSKK